MSQPAFWLKITPSYVIENFEELLIYVSAYDYSVPEPPESDFNNTVNFLSQVARAFVKSTMDCNAEDKPEWPVDDKTALRMVCAAILCEHKRGTVAHDLFLGLIKMILHVYNVAPEHKRPLIATITACARKAPLKKLPVYFRDIDPAAFSEMTLVAKLALLHWDTQNAPRAFYEGCGTALFGDHGVELAPMNHDDILKTEGKRHTELEALPQVQVTDTEAKRRDIHETIDFYPSLLRMLGDVKPSAEKSLSHYEDGDPLDVRVTDTYGIKIVCESTDPQYERVSGKILLDNFNFGISRKTLAENLHPGDILPAYYRADDKNELVFEIDQNEELEGEFKQYCQKRYGETARAIFTSEYKDGTRWLTEHGLQVNIMRYYEKDIDFDAHRHDGACVKIRIIGIRQDSKGKYIINGDFLPESEQILDDVNPDVFTARAFDTLAKTLVEFMKQPVIGYEGQAACTDIPATADAVNTLGQLLLNAAETHRDLSTEDRLAHLVTAAGMFTCIGVSRDRSIARREIAYLKALISFASGEGVLAISFEPEDSVADLPRTIGQTRIIRSLKSYKETSHTLRASEIIGDHASLIEQLVTASNTLIDKIDIAELSRIKKTIAAKLGVADMFRDIYRDRPFYGFESDTLEFKVSCVRPPLNRQSGFAEEDFRIQAFTILKTVCAFLNSPAGGDLLIGVNDEGYAVGVQNDIDLLADHHRIPERNMDRLRIYIKNIIDHAFVSNDGHAKGNDITAGNVMVAIEQCEDGKEILRIKIKPYPYDVVRIGEEYCLPDHKNVYYRSSATSMPLNSAGVRNIRIRKIQSLDPNERKTAVILEAIDQQKVVKLSDYRSRLGLSDHRIEPHCMVLDNTAFQAFDHATGQMNLFKLSRAGQIEMLPQNWRYTKKHRTLPVDIFGTIQTEGHPGHEVTVKLSEYALMLLGEEYPASKNKEMANITENTGTDSSRMPWLLTTTLYGSGPLTRFASGLPDDVATL